MQMLMNRSTLISFLLQTFNLILMTSKGTVHNFPLNFGDVYLSRLFWWDISCRDACLLFSVMEQDVTQSHLKSSTLTPLSRSHNCTIYCFGINITILHNITYGESTQIRPATTFFAASHTNTRCAVHIFCVIYKRHLKHNKSHKYII